MSQTFDWAAMRRRALRDLGLKPSEFWALTPVEFLEMAGLGEGPAPMGRAVFDRLCRDFPDRSSDGRNHYDDT